MANSLLDFVMAVVRDPAMATRYAQDPAQTIADAHLTGVTSVDVNNLIPVVTESMSTGAPAAGGFGGGDFGAGAFDAAAVPDANIWASGAATAAFDAFADHVPAPNVIDAGHGAITPTSGVVDTFHSAVTSYSPVTDLPDVDPVLVQPVLDDALDQLPDGVSDTLHAALDDYGLTGHPAPGFDLFD